MKDRDFAWNDYNLDKIAKHGVTREEAEHVVRFFKARPHRKGTWIVLGRGNSNRKLQVVFMIKQTGKKTSKPKRAKLDEDGYPVFKTVAEFQEMSQEDKDRVWEYYNRKIPRSETRAPTAAEQAQLDRALGRPAGRPKIGLGAKVVAVTLEKGFLSRVDAYAKKHELKRAEMIARGLRLVMGEEAGNP